MNCLDVTAVSATPCLGVSAVPALSGVTAAGRVAPGSLDVSGHPSTAALRALGCVRDAGLALGVGGFGTSVHAVVRDGGAGLTARVVAVCDVGRRITIITFDDVAVSFDGTAVGYEW